MGEHSQDYQSNNRYKSSGIPLLCIGKCLDAVTGAAVDLLVQLVTLGLGRVASGNRQTDVADAIVKVRALFFTHRARFHR